MILCVGALGSGKSTLLRILQQYGQEIENEPEAGEAAASSTSKPTVIPITTPTMGTDLLTVAHCDKYVKYKESQIISCL